MNLLVYTPLAIFALFVLLFAIEKWFPLRASRTGLLSRLFVNGVLSGLVFVVAMLVVRPSSLSALDWSSAQHFGLLHLLRLPVWAEFIVGFLLLDLSFYYWHLLNHKIPLLWRFHNVHHIDPALDVSTGFRFHFGEVFLSTLFRVAQVIIIGPALGMFLLYELVFQAGTLFHHSNLRLPIRLERWLNKLIVTPRMHGIHHSQVRPETNSNYGVVFPWWDRLHRTLGLNIPQSKIEIGVPGYSSPDDNTLWRTMIMPFIKQRDYWSKPDGSRTSRDPAALEKKKNYLAE
ncbi:MAG: sterol desaturase family protein [Verrucomicrobia bacterium]|nr:sterol desaturase family protein [Verrucomicrobiota bacterium]